MANLKNSLLMIVILLCHNALSQNMVTFKITSKIPDSITDRAFEKTIILNVQNLSQNCLEIDKVPVLHVDYKVLKKIDNDYINMDSVCFSMVTPRYPGDDYKGIKLKSGEHLDIGISFPPLCTLFEKNATYKVKYLFFYRMRKKFYTIETEWYEFTCMFSSDW